MSELNWSNLDSFYKKKHEAKKKITYLKTMEVINTPHLLAKLMAKKVWEKQKNINGFFWLFQKDNLKSSYLLMLVVY